LEVLEPSADEIFGFTRDGLTMKWKKNNEELRNL
jgi:hypothetical protein